MIFLDSGYYKALMDKKDMHHDEALKIEDYLDNSNEKTVINTTVLLETLNKSAGTKNQVMKIYNRLNDKSKIIYLTYEDYIESLKINLWFSNSINYSDCTILNTMMNMGISKIVSFDSDFKKIEQLVVISSM